MNDITEELKLLNKEANKFLALLDLPLFEEFEDGDFWFPDKMTSTCGAVFFTSGFVKNETVYFWLVLLGSSDEAKKYLCTISIENEIENEKWSGPHP